MIGYMDKKERTPTAAVYFSSRRSGLEGYFYLAQRRYIDGPKKVLTSMGGPDRRLGENEKYSPEKIPDLEEYYSRIEEFYRKTAIDASRDERPDFSWNGLMGYTTSGVRVIGPDPCSFLDLQHGLQRHRHTAVDLRRQESGPSHQGRDTAPIHIRPKSNLLMSTPKSISFNS